MIYANHEILVDPGIPGVSFSLRRLKSLTVVKIGRLTLMITRMNVPIVFCTACAEV